MAPDDEQESERLEVQMDRAKREAKAKVESTSNFAMVSCRSFTFSE